MSIVSPLPSDNGATGIDLRREIHTRILTYVSFGLLLLSCASSTRLSEVSKLLWLLSIALLSVITPSGAVGMYIAAVAIYAVRHFEGWGSVFERPDNFALPIIVVCLIIAGLRKPHPKQVRTVVTIGGILVGYGLVQMVLTGSATRVQFADFMHMFGLPIIFVLCLMWARLTLKEVHAFAHSIALLAAYIGVICLLEAAGRYDLVIPAWTSDPKLNVTIGIGRVGGPLLQSEWNGLALGLIYCILLGTMLGATQIQRLTRYVLGAICALCVYLTYTRGAWLGLAVASFVFIHNQKGRKRAVLTLATLVIIVGTLTLSGRHADERLENSETAYFRINIWAEGLRLAQNRPMLGYGIATFRQEIAGYKGGLSSLPDTTVGPEGTVAHNTLISILVEEGIIGAILYCLFITYIVYQARLHMQRVWRGGTTLVVALSLTYFINTMFIAAYEPTTNYLYYCTMGLLMGMVAPPPVNREWECTERERQQCVELPA